MTGCNSLLTFSNISKAYDDHIALDDLSCSIKRGVTTVLIGPSGCGKSTILKLVTGLIPPDSGAISIDGQSIAADTIDGLRRNMGYVIQDGGLFPHLSAEQNVTLMAGYVHLSRDRIRERLHELMRLVRFPETLLQRFPDELSGGQRQRVSLMRALMLDPDLLLLDEPLAALDPMIRYELQRELKDIFHTLNKTVLLVTHDMGEAAYLGQDIIMLRSGKLVQQGCLRDLLEHPAEHFVETFIQAQRGHWLLLDREAG